MIEARDICKKFGDRLVIQNIDCLFAKGKTNLIIGQSGSGKTVLMKCLVGLFEVDCGIILYGMLFQMGALFDMMNVEQNVMFPLNMFTLKSQEEKSDRVNFVLKRVTLENTNSLMPSELSGGMRKRVAIARAIAMNPRYLFCDEPNSGLDPQTAGVIDHLIQEITQEYDITTIVNTHDMNSVLSIGDQVNFIYQGQLWWKGTKDEILMTENPELNDFVFGTELTARLKR